MFVCVCGWKGVAGENGAGAVGLDTAAAKQAGVFSGARRENWVA